jgi:hypothetical protein
MRGYGNVDLVTADEETDARSQLIRPQLLRANWSNETGLLREMGMVSSLRSADKPPIFL